MSQAYYNEWDHNAAAWLRELCWAGEIPWGDVDETSISDVKDVPERVAHFFAGIGGWPLALRLAGWPEDEEVWTGSCPCQPFSSAGKGKGTADERHLWPEFLRLISKCRPATVFGEQVASKAGRKWLAGVRADLEALGYAVGAADLCAAGVGAPHIRQRLYWAAKRLPDPMRSGRPPRREGAGDGQVAGGGGVDGLGDGKRDRRDKGLDARAAAKGLGDGCAVGRLGNGNGNGNETDPKRRTGPNNAGA